MQELEAWIRERVPLVRVESAQLRYDGMAHQAPTDLPGVYRPYDAERTYDWVDQIQTLAYLDALGTRGRVLDLGTGDGWPALPLAPHVREVTGIDLSARRIATARENLARFGYGNVQFEVASGEDLPFPDASFDAVVVGTALEQMTRPERALAEARRVLVPGGMLVATFEHLAAELPRGVEEEVELFRRGDAFVYRYTVKEATPPREAEYEVLLRIGGPERALLEESAASFPVRPGFVREEGEPGARGLEGEIGEHYGLALLSAVGGAVSSGRFFDLRHVSLAALHDNLAAAGFVDTLIRGRITRIAHPLILALHEAGALATLRPRFLPFCEEIARLWPLIAPEGDRVLFACARRPR
jgi:SAM-dependent methyltransferase